MNVMCGIDTHYACRTNLPAPKARDASAQGNALGIYTKKSRGL